MNVLTATLLKSCHFFKDGPAPAYFLFWCKYLKEGRFLKGFCHKLMDIFQLFSVWISLALFLKRCWGILLSFKAGRFPPFRGQWKPQEQHQPPEGSILQQLDQKGWHLEHQALPWAMSEQCKWTRGKKTSCHEWELQASPLSLGSATVTWWLGTAVPCLPSRICGVSEKLSVSPGYSFIYIKSMYSFHRYTYWHLQCG